MGMSELEPDQIVKLIQCNEAFQERLKGLAELQTNIAIIMPADMDQIRAEFDDHLDDYVFLGQDGNGYKRIWDGLLIYHEKDENMLKGTGFSFPIFSTFDMETPPVKSLVFLIENYSNPLLIDDLEKMKTLIIEDCTKLIEEMKDMDVEGRSERAQQFYQDWEVKAKRTSLQSLTDLSDELEDQLVRTMIDAKFSEDSEDIVQDKVFIDKVKCLENMTKLEDAHYCPEEDVIKECTKDLGDMKDVKLPKEKLELLFKFCNRVMEEVGKGGENQNADAFIPALMFSLIKIKPPHFISDLRFIQRFRPHSRLTGEAAYMLTSILAVVTLIEKAETDKIKDGETVYNLISRSTSHLEEKLSTTSTPSSPSMLLRPFTELNMMASNMLIRVTSYPRAFSTAVADTFRSKSRSGTGDDITIASVQANVSAEIDEEISGFREKILQMTCYDELSVKEIPMMFADYRRLLLERK